MSSTSRSRVTAVLLAAVVLIGGANLAAYAATGQPLLLGKSNDAGKKTVLRNTANGPALQLKAQPGQPPLKVNRTKKVNKLNADLVDGASAAHLQTTSIVYELSAVSGLTGITSFTLPGLAPGRYLASYSVTIDVDGTATDFLACGLVRSSPTEIRGLGAGVFLGQNGHTSGASYVDASDAGRPWSLACDFRGPGSTYSVLQDPYRSEVVLTRVDDLTERSGAASRGRGPALIPAP